MPILNGYDATKIIKDLAFAADEKVIIIGYTGYWTEEELFK